MTEEDRKDIMHRGRKGTHCQDQSWQFRGDKRWFASKYFDFDKNRELSFLSSEIKLLLKENCSIWSKSNVCEKLCVSWHVTWTINRHEVSLAFTHTVCNQCLSIDTNVECETLSTFLENCSKNTYDPDVIRTRNLLIWSQTRYRCATESFFQPNGIFSL